MKKKKNYVILNLATRKFIFWKDMEYEDFKCRVNFYHLARRSERLMYIEMDELPKDCCGYRFHSELETTKFKTLNKE